MTMKDGHDAIRAWFKAEIDDYKALQSDLNREVDRIRPRKPTVTLDLDIDDAPAPQTSESKSGATGLTMVSGAKVAIPEIAHTKGFRQKRVDDYENAVAAFTAWGAGDIDLADLTAETIAAFKADLTYYPARGSVRPGYRDLPWKARIEEARATREPELLKASTINSKYLTPLGRIFEYHRSAGLKRKLPHNPFEGIVAEKKRTAKRDGKRREFSSREIQAMFSQPMFVGAEGASQAPLYRPGSVRISDWRYWVPLISFFTGARLNEVCAIALADFRIENGLHYVLIRDLMEGQHSKSDAAWRRVPLHNELIRLRLPDYVALRREAGGERLFDDLTLDAFGYYSGRPSKFLNLLTKRIAEPDPEQPGKLVFYSSRHTVVGRLRSADVRVDVSKELIGHEDSDVHSGYGSVSLKALKEAVDKIEYEGLDLGRVELPESILPKPKS